MNWLDVIVKILPFIVELIKALKGVPKEDRADVIQQVRDHAKDKCTGASCKA